MATITKADTVDISSEIAEWLHTTCTEDGLPMKKRMAEQIQEMLGDWISDIETEEIQVRQERKYGHYLDENPTDTVYGC